MLKNKLASFILSKFNVGRISDWAVKVPLLKIPYKFFSQRLISYDFPQHLFIETTNACNLKCSICPRQKKEVSTNQGQMDFLLFKKIIDEARKYGPRTFSLHLFGEPLLAPQFPEMVRYVKKSNFQNTILLTTNGTMLRGEIARSVVEAPIDKIAISFVSAEKENYRKLTGTDFLSQVEKNVLELANLKKEFKSSKPIIYIRMILNKDNLAEAELFKKKWKGQKVVVEVRPAHNYGDNAPEASLRRQAAKKIKRHPCYHLWLSPAIHSNGDFSICCNDWDKKAVLGNVGKRTVSELWNSPELKAYRQAQLKSNYRNPSLCANCDVWTMYHDIFFGWQKKQ